MAFHEIARKRCGMFTAQGIVETGDAEPLHDGSTGFDIRIRVTPAVKLGKDIQESALASIEPLELVARTPHAVEWVVKDANLVDYRWFRENLGDMLLNLVRRLHATNTGDYSIEYDE
jgi:hypothetical protein